MHMTAHIPGLLHTLQEKKCERVKLVLWAQASPVNEMMPSWMCFPHESKMSTLLRIYPGEKHYYKELIILIIINKYIYSW